ncbi:MAG: response regulator transcription factor [Dehalococcoidia bacterium]
MRRTRVLIVDNNLIFSQALARGLNLEAGMEVVGSTGDRDEAMTMVRLLAPDVVILDADMGGAALEMAVRLRRFSPGTATVTLASGLGDEDLYMTIRAGVAAHLPKSVSLDEVASIVGRVVRGEHPITEWLRSRPKLASRLLEEFQGMSLSAGQEIESLTVPLSTRELEILEYIALGNSNKRIAGKLGVKEQSVKNYVTTILRKLSANDRAHAIFIALQRGWIQPQ